LRRWLLRNPEQRQVGTLAQAEHGGDLLRCQRGVCNSAQIDKPDALRIGLHDARGQFERQARLPDTTESGQRQEARFAEQPIEVSEFATAADEARQRRGQVMRWRMSRNGRDLMAQHRLLQLSQLLSRFQPQLIGKLLARAPVRSERVCLAFAAVEREDEVAPETLSKRMLGDEALEFTDKLGMEPKLELCLDSPFERDEPQLLQAPTLQGERLDVDDVGERTAAPQREPVAEALGGQTHVASAERSQPFLGQALELSASTLARSSSST
jgi:hypothetical protein